ncbi:MAG: DUF502 domain-containing protein [Puniceicoccales bacterium]|jgi:uncharacterized membrane protein|nr:DUF502 domain-containing protein [Puniceicoccales bacterium]
MVEMLSFLKRSFITGLVLTLPIGLTVFFVNIMLDYVGGPASKVLFGWFDISLKESALACFVLNVISIILVMIIIIVVGFLSKLFFGRILISWAEKLINHVPFVNTIYKTFKQIIETFGKTGKSAFSKTVLIEYPRAGCYAIGFLSSETEGEAQEKTRQTTVNVFVPTTPNPTSGFLLIIPKEQVTELEMSVTDGMKLIVSGGILVPPYGKTTKG